MLTEPNGTYALSVTVDSGLWRPARLVHDAQRPRADGFCGCYELRPCDAAQFADSPHEQRSRLPPLVAVVGPPASGKTTLTALLADRLAGSVFRLREFAHDYRAGRPGLDRVFTTTDPLGWFRDETVLHLLHAAFVGGAFNVGRAGVVLLENLPGNAHQLHQLRIVSTMLDVPVGLIELAVPDRLAYARSLTRRVCAVCEPDPRGDPHRPALGCPESVDRCARCGGELITRKSDAHTIFAARLARFRHNIGDIRRTAAALTLRYEAIAAIAAADTVARAAEAFCRSLRFDRLT